MISSTKMNAIVRKGELEWGCVFTMAKGGPTLHTGEAKEKPLEIQCILDQYPNVFDDIPNGLS